VSDPKTHRKTATGKKETKFGVDLTRAREILSGWGY
jgi:diaminopimelate decarboxylase